MFYYVAAGRYHFGVDRDCFVIAFKDGTRMEHLSTIVDMLHCDSWQYSIDIAAVDEVIASSLRDYHSVGCRFFDDHDYIEEVIYLDCKRDYVKNPQLMLWLSDEGYYNMKSKYIPSGMYCIGECGTVFKRVQKGE